MLCDLRRHRAELRPVGLIKRALDPVAAFEVLVVLHRPVLVQQQVIRIHRHRAARQIGEGATIE